MGDPAQPLEGAFLQALDSGPVKNLLNPVTKHIGDTLGYIGDIVRFYSHDNLVRIFRKWAESERAGKSLEEDEFKRVMPLLPLAAQVSDDELQNRWAALLESAARGDDSFLPSFGHTLSQLTADQARFLERLYKKLADVPKTRSSLNELGHIYEPGIAPDLQWHENQRGLNSLSATRLAERRHWDHIQLMIQDLVRQGIFETDITEERVGLRESVSKSYKYYLSDYGLSFIRSVSSKKESPSSESTD